MKLRILGCGPSTGVPRVGGDWGACDAAEPRNRRLRASILVSSATTTILIDTGPDLREQLLTADVRDLDAVIWTHDHADHCHGIDDLRPLFHARRRPLRGFALADTGRRIAERFPYVFNGLAGYPASVSLTELSADQMIGDIRVRAVAQPHGEIISAGLRFDHDGKSIGYATDFHALTDAMAALYACVDVWVADCLRSHAHPSHPHLAQTLAWAEQLAPRQTLLHHMDQSMDYATLVAALPQGVAPGYDGMEVVL